MIQIVERNPIWHIFGGKDKVVCEFDPDALTKQRYLKRKPHKQQGKRVSMCHPTITLIGRSFNWLRLRQGPL